VPNRLSTLLYGEKAHDREPVTVFDIGCSGGVGTEWEIFGTALRVVGFDPLVSEIERLRQAEQRPNVSYEAAFVGLNPTQEKDRNTHDSKLSARDKFFPDLEARSSAVRATDILSYDYKKEVFNAGAERIYSSSRISLDEFCRRRPLTGVDILKTDTDGYDLEVLIGAQNVLESSILAASIECFFDRPRSSYANTFSNVDRFMTGKGFYLFDIRPRTYTRAALPGPFQYDIFAQTSGGAPVWADVLYLRDLASADYEGLFGFEASEERIIKTACFLEARGLPDCAAELISNRADRLSYPIEQMLDLLVPDYLGAKLSYREYIDRFTADPRVLFPSHLANQTPRLPFVTGPRRELSLQNAVSSPDWDAALSAANGGMLVTTSRQNWAYAMILPLPHSQRRGVILVEAEVVEGQVGVSIANADHTELAGETILSSRDASTVMLPVSRAAAGDALMIRNAWSEGPSRVVISRVEFFAD
jgi:FkbM family methyltransferase